LEGYNGILQNQRCVSCKELGHKSIKNTEIYINIESAMFEPSRDEFTVRVVEKTEEVKALLEVGFEYIYQKNNLIFLRKRK